MRIPLQREESVHREMLKEKKKELSLKVIEREQKKKIEDRKS